jgi:hypothetical protein
MCKEPQQAVSESDNIKYNSFHLNILVILFHVKYIESNVRNIVFCCTITRCVNMLSVFSYKGRIFSGVDYAALRYDDLIGSDNSQM